MDRPNRFRQPPSADPVGAVRSSIATRLNVSLLLRQLVFFLLLDLLLAGLALCGTVFYAESRCVDVAALVEQRGIPSADALSWMETSDYTILLLDRPPQGYQAPALPFLPVRTETADALRSWGPDLHYQLELNTGGQTYAIQLDLRPIFAVLRWGGLILLVWQGIALLSAPLRNSRAIKAVLRPIQDLAAATARLNSTAHMSRRQLEDLAEELGKINAQHLDSRIDASGTQKELRALAQAINAMRAAHPHRRHPGLRRPAGPLGQVRPGGPAGVH